MLTEEFGLASSCASFTEVQDFIRRHTADPEERRKAAAFALVLASRQDLPKTQFFEDARSVVDRVGSAKAAVDSVAWHSLEVVEATGKILHSVQRFMDEQTIPCTEWPTPQEMADAVLRFALSVAGGR